MKKAGGEPVCVYSTQDLFEAEIIGGLLKSGGIPCHVQKESFRGANMDFAFFGASDIRIFVPADRAVEARALIASRPGDEGQNETGII